MVSIKVQSLNIKKEWLIALGIIVVVGIGFLVGRNWKMPAKFFEKLPASLPHPSPTQVTSPSPEEKLKLEEISLTETKTPQARKEGGKYIEVAAKGEGLTHLARRALKAYLQEHSVNFELKPEHKIYIEDYLALKMGYRWLKVGEEVGFSEDLIQEALNKAQSLTPVQIQNLSQFVPLVPSL
jgi:hypothetical protein